MLNRKLLAAFLTAIICYFIVPFFFRDFSSSYFEIGLAVSIITVPILFIVGILSSIAIELLSKHEHILFTYVKHLGCGIICVIIILLLTEWEIDFFLIYTLIATVYVTVFSVNDYIIKRFENKELPS